MAFSAADLKPLVRVCSSSPGEPTGGVEEGGSSAIKVSPNPETRTDHSREVPTFRIPGALPGPLASSTGEGLPTITVTMSAVLVLALFW
jgi:hypothetical protein